MVTNLIKLITYLLSLIPLYFSLIHNYIIEYKNTAQFADSISIALYSLSCAIHLNYIFPIVTTHQS